jgi:hypothetical protein
VFISQCHIVTGSYRVIISRVVVVQQLLACCVNTNDWLFYYLGILRHRPSSAEEKGQQNPGRLNFISHHSFMMK